MSQRILIFHYFLFLIFVLAYCPLTAQNNDIQSWTMTAVSKKLNSNYSTSLTVINRVNDNISKYNDVSFDWKLRRKFKGGFTAQVAFRHWTFRVNKPIYFFWYDLIHVYKKTDFKWINLLRYHHGLDWVDKEQADFLRWRNQFYKNFKDSKIVPFIGYDLWYRLNDRNDFQNLWLDVGAEYELGKIKLRLNYRRITLFKNQPGWRRHILVTGFFYSID